jgi:hypothetical protein
VAFDQTAGFYRKATELLPPDAAEACPLRGKLAGALANAGRGAEAGPVHQALAEESTGVEELDLLRRAMRAFLVSGRTEEGMDHMTRLLGRFGVKLPTGRRWALVKMIGAVVRLRLRGTRVRERPAESIPEELLQKIDTAHVAIHCLVYFNPAWTYWLMAHWARWALDAGEAGRAANALAGVGFLAASEGAAGFARGERAFATAREACARLADPLTSAHVGVHEASASWAVGRWDKLFDRLERCDRIAADSRVSLAAYLTHLRHLRLDGLMMAGRWKDYAALVGPYLEDSHRKGDRFAVAAMTVHSYLPALAAGRPDLAEERIRRGWEAWPQKGNVMGVFWGLYGRVEAALYRGDGAGAVSLLGRERDEMGDQTHYKLMQFLRLVMTHLEGRAALAAAETAPPGGYFGTRSRLAHSAAGKARVIERAGMPWSDPLAALLRAGASALRNDQGAAIRHLAAAEGRCAAAAMRMYGAAARWRRGQLLEGDEGAELIRRARDSMTEEGVREPDRVAAVLTPGFPT